MDDEADIARKLAAERRFPGVLAGLALGALLAFPAGVMLGRSGDERAAPAARPATEAAEGLRNPYSPDILDDPAFVAAQRRNLEALERACEQSGALCEEAEAFRRALAAE